MSRRTFKRIFRDKEKLDKLIELYTSGKYSVKRISLYFNVHHSSILHWVNKLKLEKKGIIKIIKITPPKPISYKFEKTIIEDINQGHSYSEYLKIERQKHKNYEQQASSGWEDY